MFLRLNLYQEIHKISKKFNLCNIKMSQFDVFTPQLIRNIALSLSFNEIMNLCNTNSRFNAAVCNFDNFWRLKSEQDFGVLTTQISTSWKDYYMAEINKRKQYRRLQAAINNLNTLAQSQGKVTINDFRVVPKQVHTINGINQYTYVIEVQYPLNGQSVWRAINQITGANENEVIIDIMKQTADRYNVPADI